MLVFGTVPQTCARARVSVAKQFCRQSSTSCCGSVVSATNPAVTPASNGEAVCAWLEAEAQQSARNTPKALILPTRNRTMIRSPFRVHIDGSRDLSLSRIINLVNGKRGPSMKKPQALNSEEGCLGLGVHGQVPRSTSSMATAIWTLLGLVRCGTAQKRPALSWLPSRTVLGPPVTDTA